MPRIKKNDKGEATAAADETSETPEVDEAEANVGKPLLRKSRSRENMKVELTDKEVLEAAEKLAEATKELGQLELDMKSARDQIKSRISAAEARVTEFSSLVSDKHQWRQVEVEEVRDMGAKKLYKRRLDTDEIFFERDLADWELQTEIDDAVSDEDEDADDDATDDDAESEESTEESEQEADAVAV